ncbi:ChaN family lipoprotein [Campylobacter portucalensis]|nr:ChaN family lipoprotein [Campylobacter portucalensis]
MNNFTLCASRVKFTQVIFCLLFIVIFLGCSFNKLEVSDDFNDFRVINSNTKEILNYEEFINLLLENDIILLGESHKTPYHHFLEKKIILDLAKFKPINVVFEMGGADLQKDWDNATKNRDKISPNKLKKALNWDDSWDFKYYGDLVSSLFYGGVKFSAGNLSKDEINTIYSGAMPLYGIKSTTKDVKEKIKLHINRTHKIDEKILEKMVEIQQFKDRRMADKLVNSDILSVLVAGRFHVDKNFGAPLHIDDFNKNKKYAVVVFGDIDEIINEENSLMSDYFIEFKQGLKW